MNACDEVLDYLEVDPFLAEPEAAAARAHLAGCARCGEAADALSRAYGHLGAPPNVTPMPDVALLERIEAALAAEPTLEPRVEARVEAQVEARAESAPKVAPEPAVRLVCSFCHGPLEREAMVCCASCLAPHHADCFATHGTCSVIGCAETNTVRATAARPGARRAAGLRRHATLVAATLLAGTLGIVLGARRPDGGGGPLVVSPTPDPAPPATPGGVGPSSSSPLTVRAELERTVLCDPSQPVHLVVTVAAREREATATRPPARIALVVDHSSSMAAEGKMTYARRAVEAFLAGLGPQDQVTVIGFGNDAGTVVPWQPGGAVPLHLLARLQPQGGTNIGAAIEAGARALDALGEQRPDVLRRVVLLTDGAPTVGVTQPEQLVAMARALQQRGVTLSCQGFGKDINAPLMISLAELGGGTYLYVDQGELAVRAFEIELSRALGTLVTGTQVRLEPAPGVVVEQVVSWTTTPEGAGQLIHVGDLPAGGERKIVARLRWSDPAKRTGGELPVLRVRWNAVAVADGATLFGEQPVAATLGSAEQSVASVQRHLQPKLVDARLAQQATVINGLLQVGNFADAKLEAQNFRVLLNEADAEALKRLEANPYLTTNNAGVLLMQGKLPEDLDEARAAAAAAAPALGQ